MRDTQPIAAIALALLAGVPLGCLGNDKSPPPARSVGERSPVERVYLGVSCHEPNSVSCDQVGLYVWLRRPARRVTALVAGRELPMRKRVAPSIRPGTQWEAFLTNAGLDDGPLAVQANTHGRWFGRPEVTARIRLTLQFSDRPAARRSLRAPLRAGYG